jgi:Mg2+ and Co2+ transporter CorA
MRVFHLCGDQFSELTELPTQLPAKGFLWVSSARHEFELNSSEIQAALQRWTGSQLVDLHVSDLLNNQLPSNFDYTSWYDLLVFRRLATNAAASAVDDEQDTVASAQRALRSIDTSPVGFAVFDRVLLTVHPADCQVREFFADKLGKLTQANDLRGGSRLPSSSAELMLRMVNHMVDGYLELRRLLTRKLGTLQQKLLDPRSHFDNWPVLLEARNALHALDDTCEDQRSAIQEWIDAMDEWPLETDPTSRRERELLRVRSSDVLEHVERVLTHVRRLESSSEAAVQMHFSALGHRTNSIMRTLTVLTAIFMPLNLITGFFGMNFDALPLIHSATGIWEASLLMLALGLGLGVFFWRKRYLSSQR